MNTKIKHLNAIILIVASFLLFACTPKSEKAGAAQSNQPSAANVDIEFTLKTIAADGKLAYIGVGGSIDGIVNPDLTVKPGSVVRFILVNGDGMPHDLFLPDFNSKSEYVSAIGDQTEMIVQIGEIQPGTYVYYCTVPGHRQAGQEGSLVVANP